MNEPETHFAKSAGLNIAYQVVGDGPIDLVYVPGFVSNVELSWEEPLLARFLYRLASFSRLIMFDKRGTGLSDRVSSDALPALEDRMDDLVAVLDAVGSKQAALFSQSEGGSLSALFAATFPDRTTAFIASGMFAKRIWSPDYPWAPTSNARAAEIEAVEATWGSSDVVRSVAPSAFDDAGFRERISKYLRRSASPGDAATLYRINTQIDIRAILPTIRVPTLILHRTGDRDANVEEGRWIASQIPGARFEELPGDDHLSWVGDQDLVLDHVQEFLTGTRGPGSRDRTLVTILFTDLASSTATARDLGDAGWVALLGRHDLITRTEVELHRGRVVKTTGDGCLAAFDGPARAVRCALSLVRRLRSEGLAIRAAVHTGEVELGSDGDLHGIAVHAASRIEALAQPGEVLVSRTVIDLVSGSGLVFGEPRSVDLRDLPGRWEVAAAEAGG